MSPIFYLGHMPEKKFVIFGKLAIISPSFVNVVLNCSVAYLYGKL